MSDFMWEQVQDRAVITTERKSLSNYNISDDLELNSCPFLAWFTMFNFI